MTRLLIATRNDHKLREIRAVLGEFFAYGSLRDFSAAPEVVEDANTFSGNANKKAVSLATWLALEIRNPKSQIQNSAFVGRDSTGIFVIADDSGLEVDALSGAPGVHSARFAAIETGQTGNSPDAANSARLLRLLAGIPAKKRTARFRCVIALTPVIPASDDPRYQAGGSHARWHETELFDGVCEGQICFSPRGHNGFGYDPLFIPNHHSQTFAELGDAIKNQISHRAQALAKLKQRLAGSP